MTGAGTDRTRPKVEGGPAIILVRPQLAVNIGMCARAMANFGLSDLRLVNPREGWPRTGALRKGAYAAAAGAVHLLEGAKLYDSARSGRRRSEFRLGDDGARARPGQARRARRSSPWRRRAARHRAGERHGVLFGPERTGLDNDEVALADAIITFPVNPAYASLNLAQAVLLTGYEWFRASQGDALPFERRSVRRPRQREMMIVLLRIFRRSIWREAGFFRPDGKRPVMQRNLRNMFHRMELTQQDVRTLRGAIVRLVEGPRKEAKTRKRVRAPKQANVTKAE